MIALFGMLIYTVALVCVTLYVTRLRRAARPIPTYQDITNAANATTLADYLNRKHASGPPNPTVARRTTDGTDKQ